MQKKLMIVLLCTLTTAAVYANGSDANSPGKIGADRALLRRQRAESAARKLSFSDEYYLKKNAGLAKRRKNKQARKRSEEKESKQPRKKKLRGSAS